MLICILQDLLSPASPLQFEFMLSEFTAVSPDNDTSISFNLGVSLRGLKRSIVELADIRYHRALNALKERTDTRDRSYKPKGLLPQDQLQRRSTPRNLRHRRVPEIHQDIEGPDEPPQDQAGTSDREESPRQGGTLE
jgi:hypothetical protein